MRRPSFAAVVAGTVLAALAGSAAAVNCYEVLDRNDNVVYRGSLPPVDMSEKGVPERDAMRARGQHLIAMNVDRCLGVEYFTGAAGTTTRSTIFSRSSSCNRWLSMRSVMSGMASRKVANRHGRRNITKMIAPLQRRPISSLARWKRAHNSGTGRDTPVARFILTDCSYIKYSYFQIVSDHRARSIRHVHPSGQAHRVRHSPY